MPNFPAARTKLRILVMVVAATCAAAPSVAAPPSTSVGESFAAVAPLQLAMMDDMHPMPAMKKMDKMKDKMPMKKGGAMGAMKDGDEMMGGMPPGGAMSADPTATPSNADMMGRMRGAMQKRDGMKSMTSAAALPGFPGSSHLYHIGATGFFLDQDKNITLTTEQKTALGKIRQKATLERASFDRKIEEAEQELWTLTGSDSPDAPAVDAKVRAIEALRGDQRLAFIRNVGEAAKLLAPTQLEVLVGKHAMTMNGSAKPAAQNAHASKPASTKPSPAMAPAKAHPPASDTAPMPMKMH